MAVHFKFKSARDFDSINIEGHYISVGNLKESILEAKNFGRGQDDLVITNVQTGEDYLDESAFIPRNTSVLVRRVPSARPKVLLQVKDEGPGKATGVHVSDQPKETVSSQFPAQAEAPGVADEFGVDLYVTPEVSVSELHEDEDQKINEVAEGADWSRQVAESSAGRGFGRGPYSKRIFSREGFGRGSYRGPPPAGYICHRCGQPGHYIQSCPTNGDPAFDTKRMKLPVGIPRTMLVASEGGTLMLPDGQTAAMRPNENAFDKEVGATLNQRAMIMEPPEELCCPVHKGVIEDAVMISCCLNSCCDECGRKELSASGKCPLCGTPRTLDDILPNYTLRKTIMRFRETQLPASSSGGEETATKITSLQDMASAKLQKAASPLGSRSNASHEDQKRNLPRVDGADSCAPPKDGEVTQALPTANGELESDTIGESAGADSQRHVQSGTGAEAQSQQGEERLAAAEGEKKMPEVERGKEISTVVAMQHRNAVEVAEDIALGDDDSKGKKKGKKRARPPMADDFYEGAEGYAAANGSGHYGDAAQYGNGWEHPDNYGFHLPEAHLNGRVPGFPGVNAATPYGAGYGWQGHPMPQMGPGAFGGMETVYGRGMVGGPFLPPRGMFYGNGSIGGFHAPDYHAGVSRQMIPGGMGGQPPFRGGMFEPGSMGPMHMMPHRPPMPWGPMGMVRPAWGDGGNERPLTRDEFQRLQEVAWQRKLAAAKQASREASREKSREVSTDLSPPVEVRDHVKKDLLTLRDAPRRRGGSPASRSVSIEPIDQRRPLGPSTGHHFSSRSRSPPRHSLATARGQHGRSRSPPHRSSLTPTRGQRVPEDKWMEEDDYVRERSGRSRRTSYDLYDREGRIVRGDGRSDGKFISVEKRLGKGVNTRYEDRTDSNREEEARGHISRRWEKRGRVSQGDPRDLHSEDDSEWRSRQREDDSERRSRQREDDSERSRQREESPSFRRQREASPSVEMYRQNGTVDLNLERRHRASHLKGKGAEQSRRHAEALEIEKSPSAGLAEGEHGRDLCRYKDKPSRQHASGGDNDDLKMWREREGNLPVSSEQVPHLDVVCNGVDASPGDEDAVVDDEVDAKRLARSKQKLSGDDDLHSGSDREREKQRKRKKHHRSSKGKHHDSDQENGGEHEKRKRRHKKSRHSSGKVDPSQNGENGADEIDKVVEDRVRKSKHRKHKSKSSHHHHIVE